MPHRAGLDDGKDTSEGVLIGEPLISHCTSIVPA